MNTSTNEQMIEAQDEAQSLCVQNNVQIPHLLTPDALAALLKSRDQWREVAEALVQTYNNGVIYEHSEALARFDRLKAQEAGK